MVFTIGLFFLYRLITACPVRLQELPTPKVIYYLESAKLFWLKKVK